MLVSFRKLPISCVGAYVEDGQGHRNHNGCDNGDECQQVGKKDDLKHLTHVIRDARLDNQENDDNAHIKRNNEQKFSII